MLLKAALGASVGVALWGARDTVWRLPHPYEATPIQPLDATRLARLRAALEATQNDGPHAPIARAEPGAFTPLGDDRVTRLFQGQLLGPESVAVSPAGRFVLLDRVGYVYSAEPNGSGSYSLRPFDPPFYLGPGRPLGYHFVGEDTLLVCDSLKGLLEVGLQNRTIRILSNSVRGTPVDYVNDLDVTADDRVVYFSSSTRGVVAYNPQLGFYDTMRSFLLNMYSGDVSGRLLRYDRTTGVTDVVLDDLWYTNGVALGPDDAFVAVVETMGLRVMRKWLKGPNAGQVDVLIDTLPGVPDGLSRSSDGNFWLCLVVPLTPLFKFLKPPLVRLLLVHLSLTFDATKHFVKNWGCVLKVSPEGEILAVYLDPTGKVASTVSAATEHDGQLFLGNLAGDYVPVVRL